MVIPRLLKVFWSSLTSPMSSWSMVIGLRGIALDWKSRRNERKPAGVLKLERPFIWLYYILAIRYLLHTGWESKYQ